MDEMKTYTDDEIVRALECCARCDDCLDCPYSKQCDGVEHLTNAIDLIKRQQAEIEKQKKKLQEILPIVAELKTEAIKEFAERLCEGRVSNDPVVITVKAELKRSNENG